MWGSFLRTLNLFKVTWLLSRAVLPFGYLPSIYLLFYYPRCPWLAEEHLWQWECLAGGVGLLLLGAEPLETPALGPSFHRLLLVFIFPHSPSLFAEVNHWVWTEGVIQAYPRCVKQHNVYSNTSFWPAGAPN